MPQVAGEAQLRLVKTATREDELIERLSPVVHKLLWTLLGPDPERDDLAHEIFIRILRSAARVREPERLEHWAARVTVNAVKNEFRRRKLRRFLAWNSERDEEAAAYHPDFEGRELVRRTYRVLDALPARERVPLSLKLLGQASVEEIAKLTGSSVRTIKRRLKAARTRFVSIAGRDPALSARLAAAHGESEGVSDE